MDTETLWLNKLARLRVDAAKGVSNKAPHKPLLMLVLLDAAERGQLSQEILPLSAELAFRFSAYWIVVAHRRKQPPDIRLPFHHAGSGGFWQPLTEDRKPSADKRVTVYAKFDTSFLGCLNESSFREKARRLLIGTYFPPEEQAALFVMLGLPIPSALDLKAEAEQLKRVELVKQGREARFRLTVVPAYNYTCALTGYRLMTVSSGSIVDAAHIHPFADSRNNDPRNGIALSKNAHWLFDRGLWSLTDDYRVVIATGKFFEAGLDAFLLARMSGKQVLLPQDKRLWPEPVYLSWHRTNRFQGS